MANENIENAVSRIWEAASELYRTVDLAINLRDRRP